MESLPLLRTHAEVPPLVLDGPLTGLVHRHILGRGVGSRDASLWIHEMTAPLVVPPHYHETEETVVVLQGCLTFRLGPSVEEAVDGEDPLAGAASIVCGPEATFQVPARTIHGYEVTGLPARVLIFLPDPDARTLLPAGEPMPLPWTP